MSTPDSTPETAPAPDASPAPPPKGDLIRLAGTLVVVCVVAAAALAGANALTHERIRAARARVKLAGIQRVLPRCDNDPVKDMLSLPGPGGKKSSVYPCVQAAGGGEPRVVAVAVERDSSANHHRPYGGRIQVLVGIDAHTGRVRTFQHKGQRDVGVVILSHSETPGLGSKSTSYAFRKNFANRNLVGQNKTTGPKGAQAVWATKKDNPAGFVDAISGATITSRAVTEIVQGALATYNRNRARIQSVARKADTAASRPSARRTPGRN